MPSRLRRLSLRSSAIKSKSWNNVKRSSRLSKNSTFSSLSQELMISNANSQGLLASWSKVQQPANSNSNSLYSFRLKQDRLQDENRRLLKKC